MKKRMFITTIVMMLVLAIALTTSSLAWFSSSQGNVTANAATFTAGTASGSTVNLKIKDVWEGAWVNTIDLDATDGVGSSLVPVVPTKALVSQYVENGGFVADGIETGRNIANPAHQDDPDAPETIKETIPVTYQDYVWPNGLEFTTANIGPANQFIIGTSDNTPQKYNKATLGTGTKEGVFYKQFYIHNAAAQNAIQSLTFQVDATLTLSNDAAQAGDHRATGFAAFIIFDLKTYTAGQVVPANAYNYAGSTVPQNETYEVWMPFAAFTFVSNNSADEDYHDSWQFADLTKKTGTDSATKYYRLGNYYDGEGQAVEVTAANQEEKSEGTLYTTSTHDVEATKYYNNGSYYNANGVAVTVTDENYADQPTLYTGWGYYYNGIGINTLSTQYRDAVCATFDTLDSGFTLSTDNLKILNNKLSTDGSSVNASTERTENVDIASTFRMLPGEVYKVDFYYWLDGRSLNEYSDATLSTIQINIVAGQGKNIYATE